MLHISLLGEQVISDGTAGVVRTRSSRTVALVAFLTVHAGSPQARGRIAELFWPDSTGAQALTNLRRELHHLRHALGDDPSLVVTPSQLCWRDSETCRVDVRTFATEREAALSAAAAGDSDGALDHAATAISTYRGALLPGTYDDWLLDARSELEAHCVALCDLAADALAARGELAAAVDVARRRTQLRPLEEVGYRTLMRLQADLGDRGGAVSTYHHCASVLERELGVPPGRATRESFEHLMAEGSSPGTAPAPAVRPGSAEAALVGRCTELELLGTRWCAATRGEPGLVLVSGDAGVGKTRLVAEFARTARRQGAVVASARCFAGSGRLALAPVADWLRTAEMRAATEALEPVWRAEVDRLVPAGTARAAPEDGSRAMVDAWQRYRFFEGLARALSAAGRPTLLVLDDLQWCDQETLAFLACCLRLAGDAPLMVAGTLRTDPLDAQPWLAEWTAGLRATGMLTELALGPLAATDTAHLAAAISAVPLRDEDIDPLHATTGGFPLYIVEAVRGRAHTSVPAGDLTAVLRTRLEQAGPTAQEIAGLAAAVGRDFTLDLLAEASDLDAGAVARAVDELWRRRLVRERRDGYDFAHDLLREAAYARVSPPRRWLLHRRVAQALELLHADDLSPVCAQLADQYARGGQPRRALAHYRRAAGIAAARFAHAEAIRLHEAALSSVRALPGGPGRDGLELGVLEAMAAPLTARHGYASPRLRDVLERSVTLAEAQGRAGATVTALLGLWASSFVQGHTAAAHRTARRALALVAPCSQLRGPAHFAFGGSAVSLGRPGEALRHFDLAASLAAGTPSLSVGTRPDVHGRAWAAHAHWLLGDDEQTRRCRDGAVELARRLDHPYSLAVALAYAAITHQLRDELPELRATVRELAGLCDRYRLAYYPEWARVLDGWRRGGRAGIALARRGVDNLRSAGAFARMPYWLSLLADLSSRDGDPDAARTALDAAIVGARARDDLWWLPELMRLRAGYDDRRAATRRLRAAAALAGTQGSVALLRRCEHALSTT